MSKDKSEEDTLLTLSTILIETYMNFFVPEGVTVVHRISPTLFVASSTPDARAAALKDPRVKSLSFTQAIFGTLTNYGAPVGAKKAEVKAAKAKLKKGK